ncbi:glycosyltransferase 87 family protein [Rhodalgimonas zhirmunskyi]|uniref:Glycosyltransferase 87 family protein n=1 Tax=Rhodalgimonas zhirmunskyi TaxID=2964767 RepID=A0AAJ1UCX2_9RHOB|nr:glycosyltransferase 87 family protein [Rhodoalgimonas zhirmunskyi]MDQ2095653.1 glycosyltransferase 87 family protein [Rhodoalgimonas zhirmunskyi]
MRTKNPQVSLSDIFIVAMFVAIAISASYLLYGSRESADLMAVWLAGHFMHSGNVQNIYANDTNYFTMLPPADWVEYVQAQGHKGQIYPFVYPPIWAFVVGKLSPFFSFEGFRAVANVVNPTLVIATIYLAWRTMSVASAVVPTLLNFMLIGFVVTFATWIGGGALFENQPQILVSLLIVLAIERSTSHAPVAAGAALALAASIKLYPAVFALMWLAGGNRKEVLAFTIIGTALGLLSVLLVGWPAHKIFLEQIRLISGTGFLNMFNFSVDATLANLLRPSDLEFIESIPSRGMENQNLGWFSMAKPKAWAALSATLMVASITIMMVAARTKRGLIAIWPFAFALLALVSPLSWSYHFLTAVVFAPAFIRQFNTLRGWLLLGLVFVPLNIWFAPFAGFFSPQVWSLQLIGNLTMTTYMICWAVLIFRAPRNVGAI